MCKFVLGLQVPNDWHGQAAYNTVFGTLPHYCIATVVGSLLAYCINNYVLVKIKSLTNGKHLWLRTISATAAGEAVYTIIIVCIGYSGTLSSTKQLLVILSIYLFKVLYEIISTPFTYLTVRFLKAREKINIYEKYKNIDPYTLELTSDKVI